MTIVQQTYIDPDTRGIVDLYSPSDTAVWVITRINVPHAYRGSGIASALMRMVLEDADAERVTLELFVGPSDGLDFTQLEAWYKRLGFAQFTIRGHMHRLPRREAQCNS